MTLDGNMHHVHTTIAISVAAGSFSTAKGVISCLSNVLRRTRPGVDKDAKRSACRRATLGDVIELV